MVFFCSRKCYTYILTTQILSCLIHLLFSFLLYTPMAMQCGQIMAKSISCHILDVIQQRFDHRFTPNQTIHHRTIHPPIQLKYSMQQYTLELTHVRTCLHSQKHVSRSVFFCSNLVSRRGRNVCSIERWR